MLGAPLGEMLVVGRVDGEVVGMLVGEEVISGSFPAHSQNKASRRHLASFQPWLSQAVLGSSSNSMQNRLHVTGRQSQRSSQSSLVSRHSGSDPQAFVGLLQNLSHFGVHCFGVGWGRVGGLAVGGRRVG